MSKFHSILLVTSEVYPFLKTSELADVCYAHALGTREVGHDIRVMMPKYGFISERKNRIHEINRLRDLPISVGTDTHLATVKSSSINNPRVKVQAYITTNTTLLDVNKGFMVDNTTGKPFANNDERFIFFNRTVIETCLLLGWFPEIIHCVGWQTALLPAYLRTLYANEFKKTRIIQTITSFDDQGIFPLKTIAKTGLPDEAAASMRYKDKANFLRAGVTYADAVTVMSPGYAEELQKNKEWTSKWAPLVGKQTKGSKGAKVAGFPHGLDLLHWNPKTDPFLRSKFDASDTSNKVRVREQLQRASGLKVDGKAVVATMLGPTDADHGAEVLAKAIPGLVKAGVQVLIATDVPTEHTKALTTIAKKFPGLVSMKTGIDEEFAHNAIAGSTLLLKPSVTEASGQYQRCALVYGTIPVVHITGGIAEGLENVVPNKGTGNAFLFKKADAAELVSAVERAVACHEKQEIWQTIVANAMSTNVSWSLSAKPYDVFYRNLVKDGK
ncbi:MAG: glycogen/starch synthase [Bradyrhizobiaceae bacterium]|nr:glycogen/starch synthase [Bradyrhizobiaceae bacterium]